MPILLLRKTYSGNANYVGTKLLSWFNCLTGGVFLAMCFLGLLPNVQEQTDAVLQGFHLTSHFPVAECVVLMGFFLVLAIDQLSHHCDRKKNKHKATRKVIELRSLGVSDYDDGDEIAETEDDSRQTLLYEEDEIAVNRLDNNGISSVRYSDTVDDNASNSMETRSSSSDRPGNKDGDGSSDLMSTNRDLHHHHHSHEQVVNLMEAAPNGIRFIILLFALSTHALFEGIVLGLQTDIPKALHLFTAIIVHEAVVAATLGFNIARAKHSIWTAVRYSLLFSVTIPIGIGLGMGIGQTPGTIGHLVSGTLQGVAAGIFLHITFMQLLPAEFSHGRDGMIKTLFLFIGFLILLTLNLALNVKH